VAGLFSYRRNFQCGLGSAPVGARNTYRGRPSPKAARFVITRRRATRSTRRLRQVVQFVHSPHVSYRHPLFATIHNHLNALWHKRIATIRHCGHRWHQIAKVQVTPAHNPLVAVRARWLRCTTNRCPPVVSDRPGRRAFRALLMVGAAAVVSGAGGGRLGRRDRGCVVTAVVVDSLSRPCLPPTGDLQTVSDRACAGRAIAADSAGR
jgi:hypothetical protein